MGQEKPGNEQPETSSSPMKPLLPTIVDFIGPPTSAVLPSGRCVFGEDWKPAVLASRMQVSPDVILLTFDLEDARKPLGLTTVACLQCKGVEPITGEEVVRPYVPVSTNALLGKFQLLVKVYKRGKMSKILDDLLPGGFLLFQHASYNVKIPYPFRRKHITMLVGGSGITPMIQALHAILGTEGDETQVRLIFNNRTPEDIICREVLDAWAARSNGRLQVIHVLSKADASWKGATGRFGADLIQSHSAPPTADVLVMVCGPPSLYSEHCGPRHMKQVAGTLRDLGYKAEQVFKF